MEQGGGASKYEQVGQQLRELLKKKFRAQQLDLTKSYPRAKVLAILDAAAKAKVERESMEMIFQQCDSKSLGDIIPQQFIEVYARGVVLALERIEALKQEIALKKKQVQQVNSKGNDVFEKDRLKPRVKVVDANQLPLNRTHMFHLTFSVGKDVKKTKQLRFTPGISIPIDEYLDFEIKKDTNLLTMMLYTEGKEGADWTGVRELSLADVPKHLINPNNINERIGAQTVIKFKAVSEELEDKRHAPMSGRVNLELRLLQSYQDELTVIKGGLEEEVASGNEELIARRNFLRNCLLPCPELDTESQLQNVSIQMEEVRTEETKKYAPKPGAIRVGNRSPIQVWRQIFSQHKILGLAALFLLLYTILVLFSSFERSLFYDQFIAMVILGNMLIYIHFNLLFATKLIFGLFIQNIIDVIWLFTYAWNWWDSRYVDATKGMRRLRFLVVVSTIILFFVRFIVMAVLYKLGKLELVDEDADMLDYAPDIRPLQPDRDFSRSDIIAEFN